mmetsp:Transcript_35729/g.65580  ORF Transcript_35729/g.65580 Transcript_35729/m.65580 type:complete len:206 (+) Transcript_35729:3-620(+)
MGAQVGSNCTLFGFTLEFDLLKIGDCVSVGLECDNNCHTVENMVLKMVPVELGSYSCMQRHSFVMPGAVLGRGAVLFEESQVLKGDSVPPDEVWAGNPAEPIKAPSRPELWHVEQQHQDMHGDIELKALGPDAQDNGLAQPLLSLGPLGKASQKTAILCAKGAELALGASIKRHGDYHRLDKNTKAGPQLPLHDPSGLNKCRPTV